MRFRFYIALAAATLLIGGVFGVGAASATPEPPTLVDQMMGYSPPPPENLQVEYFEFLGSATISWDKVPRIGKYNLYRNGQYLRTITGTSARVDASGYEWDSDEYTVVSVNDFNERFSPQSEPVTVYGQVAWCSFEDEYGYYDGPCYGQW